MRQYQISELTREESNTIQNFLKRNSAAGSIDGLYWLAVPEGHLTPLQSEHKDCGPFYFGIELGLDSVTFELLVRSAVTLHCACIGYADQRQRDFLLQFIDRMLTEEKIRS